MALNERRSECRLCLAGSIFCYVAHAGDDDVGMRDWGKGEEEKLINNDDKCRNSSDFFPGGGGEKASAATQTRDEVAGVGTEAGRER